MQQQTRNFGSGAFAEPEVRVSLELYSCRGSGREPVRLFLIGSRQGVNAVIHTLHHLRFAEVFEWSHELPPPSQGLNTAPGEVMRVATKYIPML
jgi:hypothetical protein